MIEPSEWASHVSAWRASGQSVREYCEVRGLKVGSLRYWSGRIRREQDEALSRGLDVRSVRMAKVRTETKRSSSPGASRGRCSLSAIRIVVGEVQVEVGRDFDEQTLGRVLDVVAQRGGAR